MLEDGNRDGGLGDRGDDAVAATARGALKDIGGEDALRRAAQGRRRSRGAGVGASSVAEGVGCFLAGATVAADGDVVAASTALATTSERTEACEEKTP